ncbi:MAG TPA: DUF4159 domain-containing protein [Micropepsaceae bacterium]|nr:DUF4159 domain-containing protein [Micropepsaceae bacterium]
MFAGLFAGLTFGVPYVLWALAALPVIYWLLRVTPPAPKRIVFPPLRLLFGLKSSEETPARTPLWLLLMRLFAAAIAIFALAEPLYDPTPVARGNGPLVLVVDNGWPSAAQWQTHQAAMNRALTGATRDHRPVMIVATAETAPVITQFLDPGKALKTVEDMVPRPWLPDRAKTLAQLQQIKFNGTPQIMWLSDGLDHGNAKAFSDGLGKLGNVDVFQDEADKMPLAMRPPDNANTGFGITLTRLPVDNQREGRVAALDARGQVLETAPFHFALRAGETKTTIALPLELRNDTVRIAVMANESAGAVQLVDARFRRRPVGLVSGGTADSANSPLLSDIYYIERALSPYAELHKGTVDQVLNSGVAVIALSDIGRLSDEEHDRIAKFVEEGGVLLRFGGPRLAAQSDDLVPVRLRAGERLMGSSMTWASPQHLTPFGDDSPFRGLNIAGDVTVTRQVLAEPSVELADHTWARLTDGTPLVTGAAKGRGWIVLFHVAASPGWSSLPISGLYVDMLRRVVELSEGMRGGAAAAKTGTFPPFQTLDGFGHLEKPYPEATPLRASEMETATVGPLHPPGLYGVQGALIALNAFGTHSVLRPLNVGRSLYSYSGSAAQELKWPMLELALILLLIDALISLALRGYITLTGHRYRKTAVRAATAILLMLIPLGAMLVASPVLAAPSRATNIEDKALESALDTRLAYVVTGDNEVDSMSKAGLFGLGLELRARTAYEPADPVGVDIEKDNLSFYPLLYWPMARTEKDLSPAAVAKIDQFMREGGTILFDTRDSPIGGLGTTPSPGESVLRRLLSKLDIPPLEPAPQDHVLTRTFYLLKEFPGRWSGGQVWVEALPPVDPKNPPSSPVAARGGDGVSPIIMGGNDWAAAWAKDEMGNPLAAVVPGGEQQREMAIRFGINVVIYAMTGNYKTDQVHVPALLERLGK